jgi:hypothetical protein
MPALLTRMSSRPHAFFVSAKKPSISACFATFASLSEGVELLGVLLRDPRIRIIELSEYASLRDLDQHCVSKLVDLLADGLKR